MSAVEHGLLRDDQVHRNIVRLRMDGGQLRISRGNPDGERPARRGGKRSIVVTAAIAQPIAGAVEPDPRTSISPRIGQ
jgi:hypothetical protein